ncbi:MAG: Rid family hydrolase [Gammaproteobacteria bacterium]|nr:Rid family hydrolase [Gammaproteobacteria bacterium]
MKREIINPWTWQEALGFVHGNKVSDAESVFYLAGQTASDENGHCLYKGGMDFSNVMRLNIFTIDMEQILKAHNHMATALKQRGCQHTGCLLGVTALASPGALLEMEVTAVK